MGIQNIVKNYGVTIFTFNRFREVLQRSWTTKEEYLEYRNAWRICYGILTVAIRKARAYQKIRQRNRGQHPTTKFVSDLLLAKIAHAITTAEPGSARVETLLRFGKQQATSAIVLYKINKEAAGKARAAAIALSHQESAQAPVTETQAQQG